jgi:ubiquinone/menaquinone biosynthesis C-methylase UbiE
VRIAGLSAVYDATTKRHLQRTGITRGWHCLEVGAGGPSLPTWMAEQVEPGGSVLVTDINTRFLNGLVHPLIQVAQHDIANDALPDNHFDLIHARLVLTWVLERDRALRRMVSTLKPGGWLVIEDFDPVSMPIDRAFDGPEPAVRLFEAMDAAIRRRISDMQMARRLPMVFRTGGLEEVGSEGRVLQWRGGSPGMDVVWSNCMQLRPAIIGSGALTEQEFDEAIALLKSPEASLTSPVMWSVWGRRSNMP